MKPFILTLTGPTCSGKSTLERNLRERGFMPVISHTTRAPRAGEEDGKSYYFVDKEEFARLNQGGQLIESVKFNDNYYGVSGKEIERVAASDKPIVIVVEPLGLFQVRDYCERNDWKVCSVFIGTSAKVRAERFMRRMMQDIQANPAQGSKIVSRYADRLAAMMDVEAYWDSDCAASCDILLSAFDESNTKRVVDLMCLEAGMKAVA